MTPSNRIFVARENTGTQERQLPELKYASWQKAYLDAMLEMNPARLRNRVAAAEMAIQLRLQELGNSRDSRAERQSLADAQNGLLVLKREASFFPTNREALSQFPNLAPE